MTDSVGGPREAYERHIVDGQATLAALRAASRRWSTVRVTTFLVMSSAFLFMDVAEGTPAIAGGVLGGLLVVAFFFQIGAHRRVRRRIRWHETLLGLSQEGVFRLDRKWRELSEALPPAEASFEAPEPGHPFARDLDVVGDASLTRLAGPVTSERARAQLREWLLAPADGEEVRRRQEAVRELAPLVDLRHTFAAHGRVQASTDPPGTDRFLAWAEGDAWLLARPGLRIAAWILPALLVTLGVADLGYGVAPYWIFVALAHAEVLRRHHGRLQADFLLAEGGLALLNAYVPQLRLVEDHPVQAEALADVVHRVGAGSDGASVRLRRLGRMLNTVESRRNVFYGILAAVFLMDVHLASALDRWRQGSGSQVRDWLEAMGRWEALSALASVAHDHPDWTYPEAAPGEEVVVRGRALGHPLLPPAACVRNDVEVGPPGSFLLVTGSNMSGKSTLLRALGANVVLAGAGAPVCAETFSLPTLRVRTSMRIEDSLSDGVSLFMAELLRIRGIVEDADVEDDGAAPVLYLLDEILHGTNTSERRVAARAVLRHLLTRRAIGAVSTHDLTLAQAPDLEAVADPVHFRESVERVDGRTRLNFDYALRPGLATTRNALKLLDAVGLGDLVKDGLDDDPEVSTRSS